MHAERNAIRQARLTVPACDRIFVQAPSIAPKSAQCCRSHFFFSTCAWLLIRPEVCSTFQHRNYLPYAFANSRCAILLPKFCYAHNGYGRRPGERIWRGARRIATIGCAYGRSSVDRSCVWVRWRFADAVVKCGTRRAASGGMYCGN